MFRSGAVKIYFALRGYLNIEELIKQSDFYIPNGSSHELKYIELAYQNRVEILNLEKCLAKLIPDELSIITFNAIQNTVQQQILNRFPPDQFEFILAQHALGETITLMFWLKHYHHDRKLILLCNRENHCNILRLCPYVKRVLQVDSVIYEFFEVFLQSELNIKNFSQLYSLFSPNDSSIVTCVKNFLEIKPHREFQTYHVEIPSESLKNDRNIFREMNLHEGRTIFIESHGVSFNYENCYGSFFNDVAMRFQSAGFDVVTNGKTQEFPNVSNVFLPFF